MIVHVVRFKGWTCEVEHRRYHNGRPAIVLNDINDGEQVAVATVNLPSADVPDGHVLVKDWEENEGILAALVDARVVEDTGTRIPTGFVEVALCRITR